MDQLVKESLSMGAASCQREIAIPQLRQKRQQRLLNIAAIAMLLIHVIW